MCVALQQSIDGYTHGSFKIGNHRDWVVQTQETDCAKTKSFSGTSTSLFFRGQTSSWQKSQSRIARHMAKFSEEAEEESKDATDDSDLSSDTKSKYSLGIGKNRPLSSSGVSTAGSEWVDSGSGKISVGFSSDSKSLNITQSNLLESDSHLAAQNWNFQFGAVSLEPPSPSNRSASRLTNSDVISKNVTSRKDEDKGEASNVGKRRYKVGLGKNRPLVRKVTRQKQKKLVKYGDSDDKSKLLSKSVDTDHYAKNKGSIYEENGQTKLQPLELQYKLMPNGSAENEHNNGEDEPSSFIFNGGLVGDTTNLLRYDVQIPESTDDYVYDPENGVDTVWDVMRYEAFMEAQREPLLVSFLFSTILNHKSLESALAFHLANRLASPAMISTQVMSLCVEAMTNSADFGRALRKDMLAVRDRDPACSALPDVFLYFKGFHALQTYRVAHFLFRSGRRLLSSFLQSQMSQVFQIDIHPNATLGEGIMLDHGTGIVIGETAVVGHNCSILHHVTLGGSGKKGVKRHPNIGNGVLVGAGASVLGNIRVGDGSQIGAGSLVVEDVPPHCVVVGVPGKVIGSFIDVNVQPSLSMNQTLSETAENLVPFAMDGI